MLACLYDVHGNLPALEAVLADAREQGADRYLLGGDYALFGGWPREALARLRELDGATWIRGNGERWTAGAGPEPADPLVRAAVLDCRAALGTDAVGALLALPERAKLGSETLAVHASPVSDVRSFLPEPAPDEPELLAGVTARRLIFGHTHIAFRRTAGATELVNPGSVGLPFDGDVRAGYALIHGDGELEHRRVPYDHASALRGLREAFGDVAWVSTTARRLEQARFDAR